MVSDHNMLTKQILGSTLQIKGRPYKFACNQLVQVHAVLYVLLVNITGHYNHIFRIGYVVKNACIKMWATKIHGQFQQSLHEACQRIEKASSIREQNLYSKC